MPGHMGQIRRTAQNLQIIQVREADNLLLIKGAIPGANNDYVVIRESKKLPKGSERAKRKVEVKAVTAPVKGAKQAPKPAAKPAAAAAGRRPEEIIYEAHGQRHSGQGPG